MLKSITINKPKCLNDLDFDLNEILGIASHGCASMAYMDACAYYKANQYMSTYGDDVLEYLEDKDILEHLNINKESWSGLACLFLSAAIESWCADVVNQLDDLFVIEGLEVPNFHDIDDGLVTIECGGDDIISVEWNDTDLDAIE